MAYRQHRPQFTDHITISELQVAQCLGDPDEFRGCGVHVTRVVEHMFEVKRICRPCCCIENVRVRPVDEVDLGATQSNHRGGCNPLSTGRELTYLQSRTLPTCWHKTRIAGEKEFLDNPVAAQIRDFRRLVTNLGQNLVGVLAK